MILNNEPKMLDTTIIENNWRSRGFSFELWEDPPGQIWKDFRHETDELFMLLEGEVILTVDNRTLKPAIGEEVLIPAGVDHTVQTSSTTGSRWYYGYKIRR